MTPTTALQYTTFIASLVIGAESAIATPQSGATKLASVLSAIQAAGTAGLMVSPNNTVAEYTALITGIVAVFNATGVFAKKTA